MRILVTGAAGFIGSALCEQLMLSNHEVTAVDNFTDYYDVSLKRLRVKELLSPLSLEVLNLDICDQSKVEKIIASSNPEVVIHLAAQAGVRLGVSESRKYVDSNLVGFSNVLISTIEKMDIKNSLKMWFLIWIQVFSLVLIFSVWLLPAIFSGWINLNIYLQICFGTLISTFIIEFVTMQPILRLAKHYNFIEK